MSEIILCYCFIGAIAGVLAGLLGIGGGLVIVPIFVYTFKRQSFSPDLIMHMALATSLASIMFTSVSSSWAHHKRGSVRWKVVQGITPGILIGTFFGSCLASVLSNNFLKIFFILFLYTVATQLLLNRQPKSSRELPGRVGIFGAGNIIGLVSSLVGIGGGSLSVPFMVWNNINVHQAIATSAAIGFPIAVAGSLGYIINGWNVAALPEYAVGYVYLPALFGIAVFSVLTAPLGVKLAHSLPVKKLKCIFALLLLLVASKMVLEFF